MHRPRPILALCGLLLASVGLPAAAFGQVNVERMRDVEEDGYAATLQANLSLRAGNVDAYEITLAGRWDAITGPHHLFLVGSLGLEEKNGTSVENNVFAHARYTRRLAAPLAAELFLQAERDGFTLLELRVLGGGGLRATYLARERAKLFQGTSLMLERELLDARRVNAHPNEMTTVRWSNYVNVRLRLGEQANFIATVYAQPRLTDFGDVRLLNESVLAVQLTKHLSFRSTLNLRFDARPPDHIERTDVTLRNGFAFAF